jgi:hypothetical protein
MTKHDPKLSALQAAPNALGALDWLEGYYQPAKRETVKLREMSPIEQMYAYYEA